MKLLITQIAEGENAFVFESKKDVWLAKVLERVTDQGYELNGGLGINLNLTKLEPDYYLRGQMDFSVYQACSRCAESFSLPIKHSFDIALAHVDSNKIKTPEMIQESEVLDVNFIEGKEIDLAPIIQEQFFLSIPYQSVCRPTCKGLCPRCGINLNESTCNCAEKSDDYRFSILQDLKL